jgi:hypothetical protein
LATTWKNRLACSRASGRSPISSDLVDDQQLVDPDCAVDRRFPAALPLCRLERHHQIGRRGEAHLGPVLGGPIAERNRQMRFADPGRSSDILPGIRDLRFGFAIRSTRAVARSSQCSDRSATLALNTSLSGNSIGH